MKALVGAFNQEKAPVGAFSVIVQPVMEPMNNFTALILRADCHVSCPCYNSNNVEYHNERFKLGQAVTTNTGYRGY